MNFLVTHRSARFVVVQIHLLPDVAAFLAGVHEFAWKFVSETDVVGAAAPFPVADTGDRVGRYVSAAALVTDFTGTRFDAAFAAPSGDGVRNRRAGNCVDKRCFPAAWTKRWP